ncbi:hypothetical protein [Microbacterium indicum]|uniref:hypothetical protein n=1 Tax=Microbacterium indicum TaxID=358100 RepID=UPI00041BA814|nr:hypothetical protein [Microbacterium indicum]
MFRWLGRLIWLALSAFLLSRVIASLFFVDQSAGWLRPTDGSIDVAFLLAGVGWGFATMVCGPLMFPRQDGGGRRASLGPVRMAVGIVLEGRRTGTSVNDVPQYEFFVEVTPEDGDAFVTTVRAFQDPFVGEGLRVGSPVTVEYRGTNPDRVRIAKEHTA